MIHVECNPDEALAVALGHPYKKGVQHHLGRSRVFNYLQKSTAILCLVDEDPNSTQPSYVSKLKLIENKYQVKIFTDRNKNKIVMLSPNLEGWFLRVAKKYSLNLSSLNNPVDESALHEVINTRIEPFIGLLEKLIDKKVPEIIYLREQVQIKK